MKKLLLTLGTVGVVATPVVAVVSCGHKAADNVYGYHESYGSEVIEPPITHIRSSVDGSEENPDVVNKLTHNFEVDYFFQLDKNPDGLPFYIFTPLDINVNGWLEWLDQLANFYDHNTKNGVWVDVNGKELINDQGSQLTAESKVEFIRAHGNIPGVTDDSIISWAQSNITNQTPINMSTTDDTMTFNEIKDVIFDEMMKKFK